MSGMTGLLEGCHCLRLCSTHRETSDRKHPERHLKTFSGILPANTYGGYNPLFKIDRDPASLRQALCWAHSRRKFFVLADITANAERGKNAEAISPMALEVVKRIDGLFDIVRGINGLSTD